MSATRVHIDVVPAREHRLEYYGNTFDGHRAVRLIDDSGRVRGELVWRLGTGDAVEITEMGVYEPGDRRRGWGSLLLAAGVDDMRAFFAQRQLRLRRVYLFCDSINDAGRRFYEARGFVTAAVVPALYHYCDAVLYVRDVEGPEAAPR